MKDSISGKLLLLSFACVTSTAVTLWYWGAHAVEYTAIVSNYLNNNIATNSAVQLIGWASISPDDKNSMIYLLYWSLPVLNIMACIMAIYTLMTASEDVL